MDPATAGAAAYGLETAIEAGIATYYLTQPTLPLKAQLQHISSPTPIPRSSHTLSMISDKAYIFGGHSSPSSSSSATEGKWTNDIQELKLSIDDNDNISTTQTTITAIGENGSVPLPRIQHSATIARNRIFIFGGSSPASNVLKENGRIWLFDPLPSGSNQAINWLFLDPPPHTSFPEPRYGHAATSSEDGSAVFIHGGVKANGERLRDTWAFYLDEGKWSRLGDGPGEGRSGVSLTCSKGRLWRFGGLGGELVSCDLEYLELPKGGHKLEGPGSLDDSKREWNVVEKPEGEGKWPKARSNAAFHFITTGSGRDYLVLALGDPGDGVLCHDIWAYQLPTSTLSPAGLKDGIKNVTPGVESHEGEWAEVEVTKLEVGELEKGGGAWTGRSEFGSCVTGSKQFLLWGGVNEHGDVLGDGWWVKIE